jgi:VRR-NUC domain
MRLGVIMKQRAEWTDHIERRFAGEGAAKAAPVGKPFKLTPYAPRESAVLASVLQALAFYPKVAWYERMNSGAYTVGEGADKRYIRFGFPGCPDILGMLKSGTLLAIEVKRDLGRVSDQQEAFLHMVNANGGCGFVCRSVSDLREYLA